MESTTSSPPPEAQQRDDSLDDTVPPIHLAPPTLNHRQLRSLRWKLKHAHYMCGIYQVSTPCRNCGWEWAQHHSPVAFFKSVSCHEPYCGGGGRHGASWDGPYPPSCVCLPKDCPVHAGPEADCECEPLGWGCNPNAWFRPSYVAVLPGYYCDGCLRGFVHGMELRQQRDLHLLIFLKDRIAPTETERLVVRWSREADYEESVGRYVLARDYDTTAESLASDDYPDEGWEDDAFDDGEDADEDAEWGCGSEGDSPLGSSEDLLTDWRYPVPGMTGGRSEGGTEDDEDAEDDLSSATPRTPRRRMSF